MNPVRYIAAIGLLGLLSQPVMAVPARGSRSGRARQSPARWRDLSSLARKRGMRFSDRELARTLMKVRRIPNALQDLRRGYLEAVGSPGKQRRGSFRSLKSYLQVRADPSGMVASSQGLSVKSTRSGPTVRFLVGGRPRSSKVVDEVKDPVDGKNLIRVYASSREDVLQAIDLAHSARSQTAALPLSERAAILRRVARSIRANRQELARVMALEAGKPLAAALTEVDRAVTTFTLSAKEALRLRPRVERTPAGKMRIERTPVGVITAITPFNFPLNLVAHKLGPAMAAGNPVIIKPSPRTPLTSLMLADLVLRAGWPRQALSVVTPRLSNVDPLIKDPRVRMVSFTGSEEVGWKIRARAADKRVALELGGNAALVVHKDADLTDAVGKAVSGSFAYSGQVCISTQRILVHESVYGRFVKEFVRRTRQLRMGDPLLSTTQIGPMIDGAAVKRTRAWLSEAVRGGARILVGGSARGNYMEPTVVVGARPEDRIVKDEVFAPVVVISPYRSLDSALREVNRSRFGLQAGIFTKSQQVVERAFAALEVGGVVVNHVPTVRFDAQPYGGIKRSGFGREGPRYAVEEMTEHKTLLLPGQR